LHAHVTFNVFAFTLHSESEEEQAVNVQVDVLSVVVEVDVGVVVVDSVVDSVVVAENPHATCSIVHVRQKMLITVVTVKSFLLCILTG